MATSTIPYVPKNMLLTNLILSGGDDFPLMFNETGDDDYKGFKVFDKNGTMRYRQLMSSGKFEFASFASDGSLINAGRPFNYGAVPSDLNNLTLTGAYTCGSTASVANAPPSAGYGAVIVFNTNYYILQMYYSPSNTTLFVRFYNGSSWLAWSKVTLTTA